MVRTSWDWNIHVALCFQLPSCLFVRLIISDFLLSLLVFVRSASPIFHPQDFPTVPTQSGKAMMQRCRRFARPKNFWVFSLQLGNRLRLGCPAFPLVEPNPICVLIGRIRLRRVERRSRRWVARGQVAPLLGKDRRAYLCLHSHRQPAQVLTLGGDY